MSKQLIFGMKRKDRGQSFVELALVILILALMLSGVVEFGFLMNSYLKVLDGTREGARYANNGVAFEWDTDLLWVIMYSRQDFYVNTALETFQVMSPIVLNGNRGDDIVISVFSVGGTPSDPTIVRWPAGFAFGWNLCDNKGDASITAAHDMQQLECLCRKTLKFHHGQDSCP